MNDNAAPESDGERRLSSVIFGDMVGYSSFRQKEALKHREVLLALVADQLAANGGRLVQVLGDGFFAEFETASQAVLFALGLQDKLHRRNSEGEANQCFQIRIGIHMGEVVVEGGGIIGTTVNIAARAQAVAAPGGICFTDEVYQQVQEDLPHPPDRLGTLRVKGVRRQVTLYHIQSAGDGWWARWILRLRLLFQLPGRMQAPLIGGATIIALAILFKPLLPDIKSHLFPPTASELVEQAKTELERFDLPGHIQDAMQHLESAKTLDPSLTDAHAWLAIAYWRRYRLTAHEEDSLEAWHAASNALYLNKKSVNALLVQGLLAMDQNDLTNCTNFLMRANGIATWENGELLVALSAASRRLHDISNSLMYERRALSASYRPWNMYNNLGFYAFQQGDLDAALTNFLIALDKATDSPMVLANLGKVRLYRGELPEARMCAEKSLHIIPSVAGFDLLGEVYLQESNWLAAATNFDAAVKTDPTQFDLTGKAGLARLHLPNAQVLAREQLAKAADKARSELNNAWDPGTEANLGLYLVALGQTREGIEIFRRLKATIPDFGQLNDNIEAAAQLLQGANEDAAANELKELMSQQTKTP